MPWHRIRNRLIAKLRPQSIGGEPMILVGLGLAMVVQLVPQRLDGLSSWVAGSRQMRRHHRRLYVPPT
ncbi:hypothetical protein KCP69_15185 [Salmonella enterica subsp. enterica]|nr:hypothetical protein KCP69_15185 [Salmonella enterica subsp. enterica]